ncbi:unnamed protein product [Ixodes persulcatus]
MFVSSKFLFTIPLRVKHYSRVKRWTTKHELENIYIYVKEKETW